MTADLLHGHGNPPRLPSEQRQLFPTRGGTLAAFIRSTIVSATTRAATDYASDDR